jgi:hypothetical protein
LRIIGDKYGLQKIYDRFDEIQKNNSDLIQAADGFSMLKVFMPLYSFFRGHTQL